VSLAPLAHGLDLLGLVPPDFLGQGPHTRFAAVKHQLRHPQGSAVVLHHRVDPAQVVGLAGRPHVVAVPTATAGHRIGEVAARSGQPVKTIRFYSDEGLIIPIGRSEGRYRLYGDDVFGELSLIRTLKAMEIPLADGRRILEARRLGECTCGDLQATIQAKLGEIEQRITSLQQLGTELQGLLEGWRACGGQMPLTPPGRPIAPGAQSPSRSVPLRSGPA